MKSKRKEKEVYELGSAVQKGVDQLLKDNLDYQISTEQQVKIQTELKGLLNSLPNPKSTSANTVSNAIVQIYINQGYVPNQFGTGGRFDGLVVDYYNTLLKDLPTNILKDLDRLNQLVIDLVEKGIYSPQDAVKKIIESNEFKGLTFKDNKGRLIQFETLINRYIRDTLKNAARYASEELASYLGTNVYEVSKHTNARPLCHPYQGWLCSDSSGTTTDLDDNILIVHSWSETSINEVAGLLGINCRHIKYPFVTGLSVPIQDPIKKETDKIKRVQTKISNS